MTVINEERKLKRITEKYRELKESIRMMNSHRSDTEKIIPLKKGKKQEQMKLLNAMKLLIKV